MILKKDIVVHYSVFDDDGNQKGSSTHEIFQLWKWQSASEAFTELKLQFGYDNLQVHSVTRL